MQELQLDRTFMNNNWRKFDSVDRYVYTFVYMCAFLSFKRQDPAVLPRLASNSRALSYPMPQHPEELLCSLTCIFQKC